VGRVQEGVEIGDGMWREVMESFPPSFRFSPMRVASPAISILVSTRASKFHFCISCVRDLSALLETVELDVPPEPDPRVL
jgi:hypothetical protein